MRVSSPVSFCSARAFQLLFVVMASAAGVVKGLIGAFSRSQAGSAAGPSSHAANSSSSTTTTNTLYIDFKTWISILALNASVNEQWLTRAALQELPTSSEELEWREHNEGLLATLVEEFDLRGSDICDRPSPAPNGTKPTPYVMDLTRNKRRSVLANAGS